MPSIRFVNHASVVISDGKISLLSDPWYWGSAFHDGWSLIYENKKEDILNLLDEISHIWISHEHPDHFSIPFFKKYVGKLREKKIKILFQETKDKRVFSFLNSQGLSVKELKNGKMYFLSDKFKIKCIKNNFYDSALLLEVCEKIIFNLNDCPIHKNKQIKKFKGKYGPCDILLTQFSYAAWKGGRENLIWRKQAAQEKFDTVLNQARILSAQIVLPFASYIRFSNVLNFYLNDSINTPDLLIEKMKKENFKLVFFQPMEKQMLESIEQNPQSLEFWKAKYDTISDQALIKYDKVISFKELQELYKKYRERVFKNNSYWIIWFLSKFKILGSFQKINILIKDINVLFSLDLLSKNLSITDGEADISMNSQSIKFIFLNSFGFDTLTVNGCFEEVKEGGFSRATKILAIENLNNLGIFIMPITIFRIDLFILFMNVLSEVSGKLKKVK